MLKAGRLLPEALLLKDVYKRQAQAAGNAKSHTHADSIYESRESGTSFKRQAYIRLMTVLMWLCAGITWALVIFMVGYVLALSLMHI